jgi:nitrate reductase (cytochrome), electron transfer subunit
VKKVRGKELLYIFAFVLVITAAIGSHKLSNSSEPASATEGNGTVKTQLIQLSEKGRQDATTMGLIGAPPMQPTDHKDRWNPEVHHESCLACHGKQGTGAPTPPNNHFYDNDSKGKVFRDNCIQCHAQQNATNPAFNIKN